MKKIFILFTAVFFLFQCDSSESDIEVLGKSIGYKTANTLEMVDEIPITERSKTNPINSSIEKKFIKNGRLRFETDDLIETKGFLKELIKESNGYISSDNQSQSGGRNYNALTVRIPTKNFDSFMNKLSGKVEKFETKNITVEDVTARFYDLKTRLKTKKELEKKYLQILQKARSVKEILEVEREINKLRENIESTEGRFKYLSNQVSFSTLTIQFYKQVGSEPNFGTKVIDSLKDGISYISSFFLGALSIWPFILILGIVALFFCFFWHIPYFNCSTWNFLKSL